MAMEIQVISKENIKPSSPTPPHLQTFELCLIDQIVIHPSYATLVLFYPNHNADTILQAQAKASALKDSLSKTLTHFYPLAGRIKDHCSIDCNDVGAYYALALAHGRLDEFLSLPDYTWMNSLLPFPSGFEPAGEDARITNIQVNIFKCGAIAIGLCISHKIVDGATVYTFLKGWSNMAFGGKEVVHPNLTAHSLFSATALWLREPLTAMWESWFKEGKCATRNFVFDAGAISALKAEATRNGVQNPTRVEVVSALLWKCAMEASKKAHGFKKPSRLTHAVNLRRKLPSAVSKDLVGNVIWLTSSEWRANHCTTLHDLVKKVHECIAKLGIEFVNKVQGDKGYVAIEESIKDRGEIGSKGTMDNYLISSWCRMGYYEIDFGWGKPSWVPGFIGHGSSVFANIVNLMDTRCGEGIEAWVNLDEKEMEILQRDPELLAYTSLEHKQRSFRGFSKM